MINPFSDLGKETQNLFWDTRIRIWIFPKKRTLSFLVIFSIFSELRRGQNPPPLPIPKDQNKVAGERTKLGFSIYKGPFRRYDFCLQLSYATFVAPADRVKYKIVYNSSFYHFDCGYDCRRVLKRVSKSYDILID